MAHRFMIGVAVVLVGMSSAVGWTAEPEHPWVLRTRVLLTGAEATSDPAGVTFYSAVTLEATLTRSLSQRLSAELLFVNASHEVTTEVDGEEDPVGSVELLPLTATLQYRFRPQSKVQPYLGAGGCLAVFWEKSGAWDSLDLPATLAPAAQLGVDVDLSPQMLFNLDATWLWIETDLKDGSLKTADLSLDMLLLSAGVGFRF
jgi:outer membrane protein